MKGFVFGVAAAVGAIAAYRGIVEPWWRTWGIDERHVTRQLPGDDVVPEAATSETRLIDIDAPSSAVWPWLVQMGYGRAGWYSYDQLDMSGASAHRIVPEWQSLAVGDVMPTHPGGGFEVRVVNAEQALVLYSDTAMVARQADAAKAAGVGETNANVRATGAFLGATQPTDFAASWAFVLEPIAGGERTRLIERFRVRFGSTDKPWTVATMPVVGFGVFVMMRKQMLGIRDRAEAQVRAGFAGDPQDVTGTEPRLLVTAAT